MAPGIFELSLIILIAAALGITAKLLKQPLILAYLATGIVIGYFGLFLFDDSETFKTFSDLGIMFLLFLVGLEVNYNSLRLVGRASLIVGVMQIIFTFIIGYGITKLLGFNVLESTYIAIALAFSSTIIVVKLLSEKKQLNSLFGRISIGILLVQDFLAIIILIALSGITAGSESYMPKIALTVASGITLFIIMIYLGKKIFPYIFDKVARSHELLFIISLAWVFLVTSVVSRLGFSIEIGGFLAGIALANSSEHFEIASRVKTLRDFFILIFFAILGSTLVFSGFWNVLIPAIILSVFVLIGNPLIVMAVMGMLGYKKRTGFLTGLYVAQISEFSMILAALGFKLGHISAEAVALVTTVGVITITISTYFIMHGEKLYKIMFRLLSYFERRVTYREKKIAMDNTRANILIGFGRFGKSIIVHLRKQDVLVVDFDPAVIKLLKENGYGFTFGDISDIGFFDNVELEKVKNIISTSPNFNDNMTLLEAVRNYNLSLGVEGRRKIKVIVRAENNTDALILYQHGASYVLLPHIASGHYMGCIMAADPTLESLENVKRRELMVIKGGLKGAGQHINEGPLFSPSEAQKFKKHV